MIRDVLGLLALASTVMFAPALAAAAPPKLTAHHLQVSVADADALAQWYVDKLGFKIVKRAVAGTTKVVWVDIPGFRMGLAQVAGSVRADPQKALPPADAKFQGYKQIHFSVPSVDEAYAALKAEGVTFVVPPTSYSPPGIRLASFVDPEGNVLSLYEDLDPANALMKPAAH
jgi:catechol 2,3-dioxygenase-like lactoylglutathione lyase family enzyme